MWLRVNNSFQPEYTFSAEETVKPGTVIGKVEATDDDAGFAGKINYRLSQQSSDFKIDENTGEISILSSANLDRETNDEITVQVVAIDSAPGDEARSAIVPVRNYFIWFANVK